MAGADGGLVRVDEEETLGVGEARWDEEDLGRVSVL